MNARRLILDSATQVRTGRNEKMAALDTNWVILSMHSWTAWVMVLVMLVVFMRMRMMRSVRMATV